MNWRPKEGWTNPFEGLYYAEGAYEAGADAMHREDIKWLEEHMLITEGVFAKEDWQAFKET